MWNCVGASVCGTSHQQADKPCQDSCSWLAAEIAGEQVLIIAIADGAGSATRSKEGSQIVVETLLHNASRYVGALANLRREDAIGWLKTAQARINTEAATADCEPGEFATTALLAIVGNDRAIFIQLGDGAWVVENTDGFTAVTWPQTGEYANITIFVTSGDALESTQFTTLESRVDSVVGFTDGVQTLCLDLAERKPHGRFFDRMLAPLRDCEDASALNAPLFSLLDSPLFNDRTDDDKTLVLACRQILTLQPKPTDSMPRNLVDEAGRRVPIGDRVGPRGGEGEIFHLSEDTGLVAKLYHEPADPRKVEKLRRLCGLSQPGLQNVAAWPSRLLFDAANHSQVVGFVMPLRRGRRIERLYSPRDRLSDFPKVGWDFLLHVAWNCAAAFDTLHEHGILMADVNEGNILVGEDGMVRLIDCDSYQVTAANGRVLTCDVGVALWTPPELQGRSLSGVIRTPDHDRFGLAVLIFHLLFMGRHPYAGVPISSASDDTQLEDAIAQDRFAYGANHLMFGVRPPPNILTLGVLPPSLRSLFERAFGPPQSQQFANSRSRPTGREWAVELGAVTTRRCTSNPLHIYPETAGECSWCRIYREGGPRFFAVLVAAGGATPGQVEELWRAILVKTPQALPVRAVSAYAIPAIRPTPCPAGLKPLREGFGNWLLVTMFGASQINPEYKRERDRREGAVSRCRTELDKALAEAHAVNAKYQRHFVTMRAELEKLYRRHLNLGNERAEELRVLNIRKREILLRSFLDSRLIADVNIKGIGAGRKAILKAYGIETAMDIRATLRVPGIGPALCQTLVAWRAQVTSQFVFNPAAPLPQEEIAALDQQMRDRQLALESKLRAGPVEMDRLTGQAKQALFSVEERTPPLVRAHVQAVIDLQQMPQASP